MTNLLARIMLAIMLLPLAATVYLVVLVCPRCGYNMTGLHEARCPECGAQFTLNQLYAAQHQHEIADAAASREDQA